MIKTRKTNLISVQDWDDLVTETYNKSYNFQQQDECKPRSTEYITVPVENPEDYPNDSVPEVINGEEMGISFKAWLTRDPKEWNGSPEDARFLDLFWERSFYPHIDMIINDLHQKGLIEAGEYGIVIDW